MFIYLEDKKRKKSPLIIWLARPVWQGLLWPVLCRSAVSPRWERLGQQFGNWIKENCITIIVANHLRQMILQFPNAFYFLWQAGSDCFFHDIWQMKTFLATVFTCFGQLFSLTFEQRCCHRLWLSLAVFWRKWSTGKKVFEMLYSINPRQETWILRCQREDFVSEVL